MAIQDQPVPHIPQHGSTPSRVAAQTHQPRVSASNNDLFDLDFRAPATIPATQSPTATRDVKKDILSLFSTAPSFPISTAATQPPAWETSGNFQVQQPASSVSMTGSTGIGQWGVNSGWTPQATFFNQSNHWGSPAPQSQANAHNPNTTNVWASADRVASVPPNELSKKQDDVFGDLWGGHS
jgi:stromal membrane-associated protein